MQTYKIIFKINTPIAFTDTPLFDGILSYAYAREVLGDKFTQKLSLNESIDFSGMPVEMEDGYFIASKMFWDEKAAVEHTQRWRKRWANKRDSLADFGKLKRKVRVDSGEFKSYDIPLSCLSVPEVWFYFKTGNVEEVSRLLEKWVYFIGKKRSQGYGEVADFAIEKSDYDFPIGFRPIPADLIDISNLQGKINVRYCSWKPPYWEPGNFSDCIV
jgi:hypothetical protein